MCSRFPCSKSGLGYLYRCAVLIGATPQPCGDVDVFSYKPENSTLPSILYSHSLSTYKWYPFFTHFSHKENETPGGPSKNFISPQNDSKLSLRQLSCGFRDIYPIYWQLFSSIRLRDLNPSRREREKKKKKKISNDFHRAERGDVSSSTSHPVSLETL